MTSNPTPDPTAYVEVLARLLCAADVHVYGDDHPTWKQLVGEPGGRIRDDYRKAARWLAARLTVQPAVPSVSAVDQTTRDRIAEALYAHDHPGHLVPLNETGMGPAYRESADAIMPVLPPPADRAAVLREAADAITAVIERDRAYSPRRSNDRAALGGAREIVLGLIDKPHRMAAEAQQPAVGARQPDTETPFVTRVLELFSATHADAYGDLFWSVDNGEVQLFANVSDVFAWGGADCEPITPDTLPALEQAYADLKAIEAEEFTAELYAARQRGMRPQGAAYPSGTHESWRKVNALYDACGPERELGLGNPKPPPAAVSAVPGRSAATSTDEETDRG